MQSLSATCAVHPDIGAVFNFSSALFYGTVVLAWMRITGRVPSSTP